jgi:hypothetical protein
MKLYTLLVLLFLAACGQTNPAPPDRCCDFTDNASVGAAEATDSTDAPK